jgi:hypothetical protein
MGKDPEGIKQHKMWIMNAVMSLIFLYKWYKYLINDERNPKYSISMQRIAIFSQINSTFLILHGWKRDIKIYLRFERGN